jgi:methyl-accepting chemotaxis protein PixJ
MTGLYQPSNSNFDRILVNSGESANGADSVPVPERPNIAEFVDAFASLKTDLIEAGYTERGKIQEHLLKIQKFGLLVEKYSLSVQQVLSNPRTSAAPGDESLLRNLRQLWESIGTQLQAADNFDDLLARGVTQVQQYLKTDRVIVYRFHRDAASNPHRITNGIVLAEALERGWTPAYGETLPATSLGHDRLSDYAADPVIAVGDITRTNFTPYQRQLLDRFQVQASLTVPIYLDDRIWGLLVAHQCNAPRLWRETEITLAKQVSVQLTLGLQKYDYRHQMDLQAEADLALSHVIERIRQSLDIDTIFRSTVREVRRLLKADRVGVYQFDLASNYQDGQYIADDTQTGYPSIVGMKMHDNCFSEQYVTSYTQGRIQAISDIYNAKLTNCHIDLLAQFDIKANLIVPIIKNGKLWGMLAVHQCAQTRDWQSEEIEFVKRIAEQFAVGLQQAEVVEQVRLQSAKAIEASEREKTVNQTIERIRQSLDLETIFKSTVRELRRLLDADRVAIYEFDRASGYQTGKFTVDDTKTGFRSIVGMTMHDNCFSDRYVSSYTQGRIQAISDIYNAELSSCHVELLAQFDIKANLIVPLIKGKELWGMLTVHQCSQTRQWHDDDIDFVQRIAGQLTVALQQVEYIERLQAQTAHIEQTAARDRAVMQVIERIRQSLNLETIFQTTVRELRRLIKADRVGVFKFYPNSGYDDGKFVAEDVQTGYPSAVAAKIHDHCFGNQYADKYAEGRIQAVADIHNAELSDCHIEVLSQFSVRANLIVPLLKGKKLWGLLCIHQCSEPRHWQDDEIEFVKRIAAQFTVALQQIEYIEKLKFQTEQIEQASVRDRAVTQAIERIRQGLDLNSIFQTTVRELRRLMKADRVGVFKFYPDSGYDDGEFVAEDVQAGYPSAVAAKIHDHCFGNQYADKYTEGRIQAVADIHNAGLSNCHIDVLSQFSVRANLIVPLLKGSQLWGLLCIHQCSEPRHWQDDEIEFVKRIAAQFTIALQQVEYIDKLQVQTEQIEQAAERDRAITQAIERIRQGLDLDTIFQTTVRELRRLIKADRVGVFQFYPDSGYDDGEFVAEDVQAGYPSAVAAKIHDHCFGNQYADKYTEGRIQAVADIHNAGLSNCHIDVLSRFSVRANLIVPLLKGSQLWGLLCIHQCSEPRHWQDDEIEFVKRIAAQFTIALQQVEYVQQLQTQSQQLTAVAQQSQMDKEMMQQRAIQLLIAVRPALDGDLTVRAPITEDEIGTLADMYNNTIQSLRQIVIQVQTAAENVVETSTSSDISLMQLANEAQKQFQDIRQALDRIQEMVNAIEETAANAQQVEQAIDKANQSLESGDRAMNRTVEGIMEIRKTVGEAVKRIKRLDKSSEGIAKVVSLINNFATQTRLLAMNAAIEATRAGEYGRGFAVVADEVRSLAQQSSDATTEIEKLVQEIQLETKAVRGVMDIANQRVVTGTNLVGETWKSLNEIVSATEQISELMQGIAHATQAQTTQAQSVTQMMQQIAAIADRTSSDSMKISGSFKAALTTAEELQASATQFKVN